MQDYCASLLGHYPITATNYVEQMQAHGGYLQTEACTTCDGNN